jgi:hypothetical protein
MLQAIRPAAHPVRLFALAVAVLTSVCAPAGLRAQTHDGELDRAASVFDPRPDGPVLEHEPIADPAALDGATAERVYRSILPQMQAGYAASGDPLVWAYARWQRHNAVPYRSQRHGGVFVNNYANDLAAGYGRFADADRLPEGSLIVKDSFIVTASGEIRAGPLAIMEKMPAGYDPANGDWRYLVIAPDGGVIGVSAADGPDPRMSQCAACHAAAPRGQDRLFYVPAEVRR